MANPEIKVKIGSDTSDLDKGLDKAGASLAKFAKVGAAAASAVAIAMVALTKQSLAQIDVLAKQARSLGLTTEAFQKMTLVAGEAGVEAGALSSMLGLMQRNIVELSKGTALQVAAFGQLGLSIQDLQGLAPDEQFAKVAEALNGITDPAQKTATAMEVFGRAGRSAINMLEGYRAKAEEAAEFQRRFGIAVSQTTSDSVERANDAVGRLSMVMAGLGNRMAETVAPAIEKTANALIDFAAAIVGVESELEKLTDTVERQIYALSNVGAEVKLSLLGVAFAMDQMNESASASGIRDLAEEMAILDQKYAEGKISGDEFAGTMTEMEGRARTLIEAMGDVDDARFGNAISALDKLREAFGPVIAAAAKLRALTASGDPSTLETVDDGSFISAPATPTLGFGTGVQGTADNVFGGFKPGADRSGGGTSGGGTGGGMTGRVQALLESLQTEREIIADWYEESLETLQMATDAELEAIGGRHAAIERLEEEHQARLLGIKEMGNEWGVSAALQGGEEMLTALGSVNKKALKVAKVFGAARAWVDTLTGAAAELKAGTFGFARAAAVLAKGAAFVASIKGVSDSGGNAGSGGGGSSASTATASAAQPTTTFAFTIQNDPMGFGESFARQIIEQLNTTQRNGGNIRGVLA